MVEKPQRRLFQSLQKISANSTYEPTAQPPKHSQHRGVTSSVPCTLTSKKAQCILVPSPLSEGKGTNQRCWEALSQVSRGQEVAKRWVWFCRLWLNCLSTSGEKTELKLTRRGHPQLVQPWTVSGLTAFLSVLLACPAGAKPDTALPPSVSLRLEQQNGRMGEMAC